MVSEKQPNRAHRSMPACWPVYDEEMHPFLVGALRQFIKGYEELTGTIREFMLPNPDIEVS